MPGGVCKSLTEGICSSDPTEVARMTLATDKDKFPADRLGALSVLTASSRAGCTICHKGMGAAGCRVTEIIRAGIAVIAIQTSE